MNSIVFPRPFQYSDLIQNNKSNDTNTGFGNRFGLGLASLRDRASEIGTNVASSVNDLNNKTTETRATNPSSAPTKKALNNPTSNGGNSSNSIATASKQELVEVLTKMNKKVKALSALRTQLQDKLQTTENERDKLKSLVINSSVMTKRPTPLVNNDENGDGNTNLVELSVENLSKMWKEMEMQEEQELLHLKAVLSEQSQQKKVSNENGKGDGSGGDNDNNNNKEFSDETSSLREEQLKEEHDRAITALKDSMENKYQQMMMQKDEQIKYLQKSQERPSADNSANDVTDGSGASCDTNSTTPSGEGSTSEREDELKKKHTAEIAKFKKLAVLQMANFKKKVAAARSVELEKVKKETKAEVERELSKLKIPHQDAINVGEKIDATANNIAMIEAIKEVKEQHALETKSLRQKLEGEYNQKVDIQTLVATRKIAEEHQNEIQKLNDDHSEAVKKAKEVGQQQSTQETDAKINKLLSTMELQSSEHEKELRRAREENSNAIAQKVKECNEKITCDLNISESKLKLLHEEKLKTRIHELREEYKTNLKSKQDEWKLEAQKQIQLVKKEVVTSEGERMATDDKERSQERKEELEKLRSELKEQFETEKLKIHETCEKKLQGEQCKLKQYTQQFDDQLKKERQESQESQNKLKVIAEKTKLDLERNHAMYIEKMKEINATGKEKGKKAVDDAVNQTEQSVREEMTKELENMRSKLQKEKSDYESSVEQLESEMTQKVNALNTENLQCSEKSLNELKKSQKMYEDKILSIQEKHNESMSNEQNQVEERHSLEISKLRHDINADNEKKIDEVVKRGLSEKDSEVARIKDEFEKRISCLKKEMEDSGKEELGKIKADTTIALKNAVAQANDKAKKEQDSIRKHFQLEILKIEKEAKKIKDDHNSSVQLEKELQDQVETLTSKLSALKDEKNDILASAKDGESSSQNAVEEALSRQRESYEKMMKDELTRKEGKIQSLHNNIKELLVFREKCSELEEVKASMQEDFSSREKENESKLLSLESKRDAIQKELAATKSKFDSFSKETQATQEKKTRLEEKNATLSRKIEDLSIDLDDGMKSARNKQDESMKIISDLQEKLSRSETKSSELVKNFEEKNSTLSDEILELTSKSGEAYKAKESCIVSRDATISELRKELAGSKLNYEELNKRFSDTGKQSEDKVSSMSHQINKLRHDLKNSCEAEKAMESNLDRTIVDLQQQLEEAKGQLVRSVENNEKVTSKLKGSAKAEIDSASEKITELQHVVAKKNLELQELSKTLATTQEHNQKSIDHLKGSSKADAALSSGKICELQKVIEDKNKELEEMEKVLGSSHENHQKCLAKLEELSNEKSSLELKNNSIKNQLKHITENSNKMSKNHQDTLTALKTDLQTQHKSKLDKIEYDLNAEKKSLQSNTESKMKEASEKSKKEFDELSQKHSKDVEDLKQRMAEHVDKMKEQLKTKLLEDREKCNKTVNEAEKKETKREEQITKMAAQLKQVTEAVKKERNDKISLHRTIKEQKTEEHRLEKELAKTQKSLSDTISNSESAAQSLLTEQDLLKKTSQSMEAKFKKNRVELDQKSNEVEELKGKLEALTHNLNALIEDMKDKDTTLAEAKKQKLKLSSSENEVTELRQQLNKLKLELTKNSQLANRLQSEKEASERNHGQRTAMMGMLESQLAEVNEKNTTINAKLEAAIYDLSQKEEITNANEEKLKQLQSSLTKTRQERKIAVDNLARIEKGAAKKNSIQLENIQRDYQHLQQSSARKSSAAQKMIQEKETECISLRSSNKTLQQEVDKGSLSDRKIFELAAMQSNRDTTKVLDIEARDRTLSRLNHTLTERDGKLAIAENRIAEVEAQVEELGRIQRREDVNMDYLKSIVVQFLSKAPGTSERNSLLPVIATLLQFDERDYNMIEIGKSNISIWGGVEPKAIGTGATGNTSMSTPDYFSDFTSYFSGISKHSTSPAPASAEVTISSRNSTPSNFTGRGTSLQF